MSMFTKSFGLPVYSKRTTLVLAGSLHSTSNGFQSEIDQCRDSPSDSSCCSGFSTGRSVKTFTAQEPPEVCKACVKTAGLRTLPRCRQALELAHCLLEIPSRSSDHTFVTRRLGITGVTFNFLHGELGPTWHSHINQTPCQLSAQLSSKTREQPR